MVLNHKFLRPRWGLLLQGVASKSKLKSPTLQGHQHLGMEVVARLVGLLYTGCLTPLP